MATALYNGKDMKPPTDDVGEFFIIVGTWEVLRKHPMFFSETGSSHDLSLTTSTESQTVQLDGAGEVKRHNDVEKVAKSVIADRPPGRRAAKEAFMKQKQYEEKIKVAKETLKLQHKRAEEI